MRYFVYILASKRNGTLYIGVTNNLERRVFEHKNNLVQGFTAKYGVHILVHYEETSDIQSALIREKQLKKWNRKWKLALIEKDNPSWNDLSKDWIPHQVRDDKSKNIVSRGGRIAGQARENLEHQTGRKVVSPHRYLPTKGK